MNLYFNYESLSWILDGFHYLFFVFYFGITFLYPIKMFILGSSYWISKSIHFQDQIVFWGTRPTWSNLFIDLPDLI